MINTVTMIVKTFERPDALDKLIKSVRKFYPDLPILVADDSREPKMIKAKGVTVYKLPFDMGLSYGRNFLVRLVKTKYTLLLDDDFVFTANTKIEKMKRVLDKTSIDVIAGDVKLDKDLMGYRGLLEQRGRVLYYEKGNRGFEGKVELFDLVLNFFMARTEVLLDNPWDDELKVAEHTDWMFRTKHLKKGFLPDVVVINTKTDYAPKMDYFRKRGREFTWKWLEKHGLRSVVDFKGMAFSRPIHTDSAFNEAKEHAYAQRRRYIEEKRRYG